MFVIKYIKNDTNMLNVALKRRSIDRLTTTNPIENRRIEKPLIHFCFIYIYIYKYIFASIILLIFTSLWIKASAKLLNVYKYIYCIPVYVFFSVGLYANSKKKSYLTFLCI